MYMSSTLIAEKSGVIAGEQLSKGLRNNLSKSELMIAIITDAYERSLKCISEISSFWYCDKPVIPVIFNGDSGKNSLMICSALMYQRLL